MTEAAITRLLIAGPTAIGKTALSLELASTGKYEIISADSRQCYRGLDIGTGKATPEERGSIPHYNIDELDPSEPDTAARFAARSRAWEKRIRENGRTPLYVGGSTLHLQSIIWPLDEAPEACVQNMVRLRQEETLKGEAHMLDWLHRVDPVYSQRIDGYNRSRVFRALDVYLQSGKPFSTFHSDTGFDQVSPGTLVLVLTGDRTWLRERIERRVDGMLADGFVGEVRRLMEAGLTGDEQAMKTVGYKEVVLYLRGEVDEVEMRRLMIVATRRYAKRQETWYRRWGGARVVDVTGKSATELCADLVQKYNLPF